LPSVVWVRLTKRGVAVARIRIILHAKAVNDPRVRAAVSAAREDGHTVQVRVTWEAGDAVCLTSEAVTEAQNGRIDRIVAGGGDGTVNEVFATAYLTGLPAGCSLGVLPVGTANDFARSTGIPVKDLTAALRLSARAPARLIDLGLLDGRPFVNLLSGGFGSRVTAETDPDLKRRLGGLAYVLTGVSRFAELAASRGRFQAEGFIWEGPFFAAAIGNGRQAGGGIPLCPGAKLDDGLLDLMILPELDRVARLEAFTRLLRHGAESIRSQQVTTRSPWIEFESDESLYVNLDGEPSLVKRFRVECVQRTLPVHLGENPLISRKRRHE